MVLTIIDSNVIGAVGIQACGASTI